MRPNFLKIGGGAIALALLVLLAAAIVTQIKHWQEIDPTSDEQKIARTLQIIRTSTPSDRKVLKVLFYGQSITRSGWVDTTIAHWHDRYPNTTFVIQNRALGGFAAQALVRTTEQDIASFYPDLIVFHVYGDHHAYEKILRDFRSQTAADIIVQTDHAEVMPDPPCAEGLSLSLRRAPGCKGFLWVKQREWSDEMSFHTIPAYAKKYGLAIEAQRGWWRDYLMRTHIDPATMLRDAIHPNEKGKLLYAQFFDAYFDELVEHWDGQTENNIVTVPVKPVTAQRFNFDGSRLELITTKPLAQFATVTIDGLPPKDLDSCYLVSRASQTSNVPDWPAIRRISLTHNHIVENWTAIITRITPDQGSFDFDVSGSLSGKQGTGTSSQDFHARSGLLTIESDDWMIERAFEESHHPVTAPITVTWSVINQCAATSNINPEVIDRGNGLSEYRYTLVTGIANKPHSVDIQLSNPLPDALPGSAEFRAYKPPLKP